MIRRITPMLLAALLLSGTLHAQGRGASGGMWQDIPGRILLHDRMQLTTEQENELRELNSEHRKSMIQIRSAVRLLRVDIRDAMYADQPDMERIEGMLRQEEELRTAHQMARLEHWNAIRSVLTTEQYEIWKKHRRDFIDRGERRGADRGTFRHDRRNRGRW